MLLNIIVFGFLAVVVAATALGMVFSRNSIYSALFLVLNFGTVAMLYLILSAPFITMLQITVYAGAIMVLFLFVIMILGAERMQEKEPFRGERLLAGALALVFLVEAGLVAAWESARQIDVAPPPGELVSPAVIGTSLYTTYALPFLVVGFILLAAVIGAVALPRNFQTRAQRLVSGMMNVPQPSEGQKED